MTTPSDAVKFASATGDETPPAPLGEQVAKLERDLEGAMSILGDLLATIALERNALISMKCLRESITFKRWRSWYAQTRAEASS